MWKVKDGIDFNEFEKFGYVVFDFDYNANKPFDPPICRKIIKRTKKYEGLTILIENGIVKLKEFGINFCNTKKRISKSYINDLIDASMIEKVEK